MYSHCVPLWPELASFWRSLPKLEKDMQAPKGRASPKGSCWNRSWGWLKRYVYLLSKTSSTDVWNRFHLGTQVPQSTDHLQTDQHHIMVLFWELYRIIVYVQFSSNIGIFYLIFLESWHTHNLSWSNEATDWLINSPNQKLTRTLTNLLSPLIWANSLTKEIGTVNLKTQTID